MIGRRKAIIERLTRETNIRVDITLDGTGEYKIISPISFFDHMLETFARSSSFNLSINANGDLKVDQHHLIEDIGITLGNAISDALKDRKGIERAGFFVYPMDDAMAVVAVDLGGRPFLNYDCTFKRRYCGNLDTDTLEDFFYGLSIGMKANIVVKIPFGRSDHHKIEAIFKALGKALKQACMIDRMMKDKVPSNKGIIDY
ncbi:imidazoleglycerol-phosphate dehydratase HisB [Candidatus Woesearchaeota archaeon]|nr:imidazoleglycerol-phosphate dehydratase HisB [Candidatus Woesearchaeota archaeon]